MAAIRITDLDISPDMTKVVAVGIVPSLSTPPPPSSAEAPPPQSYGPGCSGKAEDRMVVYDMSTKQMTASVSLSYILTITSDTRSVDRSLELGGEITSVRISHDSRYALTSHAPGVGLRLLLFTHACRIRKPLAGNTSLGPKSTTGSSQIHRTEAGKTRYQELFRRGRWEVCDEWL